MGRRRGQRTGHLYIKGPSWILRWREDVRTEDGQIVRSQIARAIAPVRDPATGRKITKHEAERIAWAEVLSRLDQATMRPGSLMTVTEFCRARFEPDWVLKMKAAGKKHYGTVGDGKIPAAGQLKHVALAIGGCPLRSVRPELVQQACDERLKAGKSVQTVVHFRNVVSAIFTHARNIGYFSDPNPAAAVRLPEMRRKETHALNLAQVRQVLSRLPRASESPARPLFEIVAISVACSLNIAEVLALRWKWINLSDQAAVIDHEAQPPRTLRVVENNYRGAIGSPKAPARKRVVPIAEPVRKMLEQWRATSEFQSPDDFVFAGRRGRGLNENNLRKRVLAPIGKAAKLPFNLSWHVFRHTHATLAEQLGIPIKERMANMGHSSAPVNLLYTHAEVERRRAGLEQLAQLLEL